MTVDKQIVSSIGRGVLVFAAMAPGDTQREADAMASKVLKMRLWDDDEGGRVGSRKVIDGWQKAPQLTVRHQIVEAECARYSGRRSLRYVYSAARMSTRCGPLTCLNIPPVSQFTLLASTKKGSKPDFHATMSGPQAKELYEYFFSKVQQGYETARVKDGVFQAMMEVGLVNDGPVR